MKVIAVWYDFLHPPGQVQCIACNRYKSSNDCYLLGELGVFVCALCLDQSHTDVYDYEE